MANSGDWAALETELSEVTDAGEEESVFFDEDDIPAASEEPSASPDPEASEEPSSTDEPEGTEEPSSTDEPEASATPEASEDPEE